jgi:hypothetical protein
MKKKPEDITASPLSILAIRWRNMPPSRGRDRIFMEIAEHYMPRVKKCLEQTAKHNHCDYIQIYHHELYKALNCWKMNSNFQTYFYSYFIAIKRRFMGFIKHFEKDTIDYVLFADVEDTENMEYEDTDKYDDEKDNYILNNEVDYGKED